MADFVVPVPDWLNSPDAQLYSLELTLSVRFAQKPPASLVQELKLFSGHYVRYCWNAERFALPKYPSLDYRIFAPAVRWMPTAAVPIHLALISADLLIAESS